MPINIHKMKFDSSFSIKLPDYIFDAYTQNVYDYFATLEKNLNKVSPDDAMDVISALNMFREYFNSESEWEHLTLHSLNLLQKGIQRSHFDKIANFSGLSHIAFVIYDLSITTPKIKPFLQRINELLVNNLSEYLKDSDKKTFNVAGNYEVIKGLSGPLRYLLCFDDDEKINKMVERIIDIFIKRSNDIAILGYRVPGWHYYPSRVEKAFSSIGELNGCINYGVSHGMGSPLLTLSLAYKKGISKIELKDAINRLVSEYMNALYYVNDIVYWPSKISFEQYAGLEEIIKKPNQMSWCYGSVGILRALYISGVLVSNDEVAKFATSELINIAKMDLSDYLLTLPIVCHGLVGTAAILNLMYLETGKTDFLKKTVEMIGLSAMIDIESFFEISKQNMRERGVSSIISLHNHLEGYNGIIQTILSIIKGCPSENEKRLLMV